MIVMSNLVLFTSYVSMMMKCRILGKNLVVAVEEVGEVVVVVEEEEAVMMMTKAEDFMVWITMDGWEISGSQTIMTVQNV